MLRKSRRSLPLDQRKLYYNAMIKQIGNAVYSLRSLAVSPQFGRERTKRGNHENERSPRGIA